MEGGEVAVEMRRRARVAAVKAGSVPPIAVSEVVW